MPISVEVLVVVRGRIGGTIAGSDDGFKGIFKPFVRMDRKLDLRAFL
jgi:hypothetical protein